MAGKGKNLIVGLDLDGVILDHAQNRILAAKERGITLRPEDATSDGMKKVFSPEQYKEIQLALYHAPPLALSVPLISGAKEGIAFLREAGIPFHLISRRKTDDIPIRLLEQCGLWPAFFNKKNTFLVKEKIDKNVRAEALGVNVYLDDEEGVLTALSSVKHKFLLDPFKTHDSAGKGYALVSSWGEFLGKIGMLV